MDEPGCGAGPAMDEPGCGAQFRAAVQVIQGLPRSGAYRPSYEEMLRFYSYYKQATAGRCQGPRPGFWDPIGRYKWDAWHSLGAMSKEEAMAAYVAEMKKVAQKVPGRAAGPGPALPVPPGARAQPRPPQVIDTVPMDESTQEMFRYFEPLYEVIHDMPRPPEAFFRSTAESQGQQDGTSQDGTESSPAPERPRDSLPGQQHVPGPGLAPGPEVTQVTSDSEGDTFSDTLEQMEPEKAGQVRGLPPKSPQAGAEPPEPLSAGQGEGRRAEGSSSSSSTGLPALGSDTDARLPGELEAQVAGAVRALQEELRRVRERLSRLETLGAAQGQTDPGLALAPQAVSRWRLPVSPRTLLFLATWPFVTQWLLRHWQGRKR